MQTIKRQPNHYYLLVLISLIVSLVVMGAYQFFARAYAPRIMTVHLSDLINQQVKQFVQEKLPPEQLQSQMQSFAKQLDKILKHMAQQRHAVILVSEAVASGAEDITSDVESELRLRKAA